ncbi:hypothetical protein DITRI_Ditri05aG0090700 [Diplodiscus trichospermus]
MSLPEAVWKRICELGNGFEGNGIGKDAVDEEDLGDHEKASRLKGLKGFVLFMSLPEVVWKRICELGNGFERNGIGKDAVDEEDLVKGIRNHEQHGVFDRQKR